ncbi:MAG: methyltransferase family protein [Planctomycetota bacterium]
MLWLRSLLFFIAAPGTVCVLVPWLVADLWRFDVGWWRYLGFVPFAPGLAMLIWSFRTFVLQGHGTANPAHPPRELVVGGLYRRTRNPMYAGIVLVLLGEVVLFGSLAILCWAALAFTAFHLRVTRWEEPRLKTQFGSPYEAYCATVRRWL